MEDSTLNLWLMYADGQLIAMFLRAAICVRSKLNGIRGYGHYLRTYFPQLLFRWAFASAGFLMWFRHPGLFGDALRAIGLTFSGDVLPLTIATAWIYGLSADSLLDKLAFFIPDLNREIPPANGTSSSSAVNPHTPSLT